MAYHRKARGLWQAALIVLVTGSGIAYLFYRDRFDDAAYQGMIVTAVATILITGLLVICATADWWLHR